MSGVMENIDRGSAGTYLSEIDFAEVDNDPLCKEGGGWFAPLVVVVLLFGYVCTLRYLGHFVSGAMEAAAPPPATADGNGNGNDNDNNNNNNDDNDNDNENGDEDDEEKRQVENVLKNFVRLVVLPKSVEVFARLTQKAFETSTGDELSFPGRMLMLATFFAIFASEVFPQFRPWPKLLSIVFCLLLQFLFALLRATVVRVLRMLRVTSCAVGGGVLNMICDTRNMVWTAGRVLCVKLLSAGAIVCTSLWAAVRLLLTNLWNALCAAGRGMGILVFQLASWLKLLVKVFCLMLQYLLARLRAVVARVQPMLHVASCAVGRYGQNMLCAAVSVFFVFWNAGKFMLATLWTTLWAAGGGIVDAAGMLKAKIVQRWEAPGHDELNHDEEPALAPFLLPTMQRGAPPVEARTERQQGEEETGRVAGVYRGRGFVEGTGRAVGGYLNLHSAEEARLFVGNYRDRHSAQAAGHAVGNYRGRDCEEAAGRVAGGYHSRDFETESPRNADTKKDPEKSERLEEAENSKKRTRETTEQPVSHIAQFSVPRTSRAFDRRKGALWCKLQRLVNQNSGSPSRFDFYPNGMPRTKKALLYYDYPASTSTVKDGLKRGTKRNVVDSTLWKKWTFFFAPGCAKEVVGLRNPTPVYYCTDTPQPPTKKMKLS